MDEAAPEAKITVSVSPEQFDLLVKAAKNVSQLVGDETVNDFERQNPASKQLMDKVKETFQQASQSMLKEIKEVLGADNK